MTVRLCGPAGVVGSRMGMRMKRVLEKKYRSAGVREGLEAKRKKGQVGTIQVTPHLTLYSKPSTCIAKSLYFTFEATHVPTII